jgi:hypothetical protein
MVIPACYDPLSRSAGRLRGTAAIIERCPAHAPPTAGTAWSSHSGRFHESLDALPRQARCCSPLAAPSQHYAPSVLLGCGPVAKTGLCREV